MAQLAPTSLWDCGMNLFIYTPYRVTMFETKCRSIACSVWTNCAKRQAYSHDHCIPSWSQC